MRLDREQFLAAAIAIGAVTGACNFKKDGSDTTQAAQVAPEPPGAAAPGAAQQPGSAGDESEGQPISREHATDVAPSRGGPPGIPTSALREGSSAKGSSFVSGPTKEAGVAPTKEAGIAPTKEVGIAPTKEAGKVTSPTSEYAAKKPPAPTAEK
jgi:hypothetical protein